MLKIIAHYRQTFADSFRAIILFWTQPALRYKILSVSP